MGTPKVGSPKVWVSGRSRKAIATVLPALAVRGPVSTATGGIGRASGSPGPHRSAYWRGVPLSILHGVRVPFAATKAPTSPSPRRGRRRRAASTCRRPCCSAGPRPSRRRPRGPPRGLRRGPRGGRARPRCPSGSGAASGGRGPRGAVGRGRPGGASASPPSLPDQGVPLHGVQRGEEIGPGLGRYRGPGLVGVVCRGAGSARERRAAARSSEAPRCGLPGLVPVVCT